MIKTTKTSEKILQGPYGKAVISDGRLKNLYLTCGLDYIHFESVAKLEKFLVDANELHKLLKQEGL